MNVYDDLIEEFTETPGEDSEAIEFMKIKRLDRIADALEGIETRLDALEELQDTAEQLRECIGYEGPARYAPPGAKAYVELEHVMKSGESREENGLKQGRSPGKA